MNNSLYTNLSEICHSFYRLYFPHKKIASTINNYLKRYNCKNVVFFGGLLDVAKLLHDKGYKITFVDYTEEMVNQAKKILTDVDFVTSDMRKLKLDKKQDAIILIGRIFTYMYTNEDAKKALTAFKNNLHNEGVILFDNYEMGKIDSDQYFNGVIEANEGNRIIKRISKISKKQESPALYTWDCVYEDITNGHKKIYEDKNHILRAFTKDEIRKLIEDSGLEFIEHTSNFEKRSFLTVAQKK